MFRHIRAVHIIRYTAERTKGFVCIEIEEARLEESMRGEENSDHFFALHHQPKRV